MRFIFWFDVLMNATGTLSIDISAICANWQLLNSKASGVVVGAVIKADAYGLGAEIVGSALYAAGAREFFFATKAEALKFKTLGLLGCRYYVLGGTAGEDCTFIESGLIPVLFSISTVIAWAQACRALGVAAPSAVKINTGMTRLGLDLSEFEDLLHDVDLFRAISAKLVMSHLACSEDSNNPINAEQLFRFERCVTLVRDMNPGVRFSLANSSGIFLGPKWHFDLLRPGAALYGINPTPGALNPMSAVIRLSLPIMQIRRVAMDTTVGYGAAATVAAGARLAVVAGGYADGLQCTLGRAPEAMIAGQRVCAVGRISMDSMVFDVSSVALTDGELVGASVDVINDVLSLEYLMKKNNTLGYEVLTSLGGRFKRVYTEIGHDRRE